jgi:hypothetical protein
MVISHDHIDLEPLIPFLSSEGFFFGFLNTKSIIFLDPCKIPERCIYHTPILNLGLNSVFGLWDPEIRRIPNFFGLRTLKNTYSTKQSKIHLYRFI